jgi:hypothetical protein
MGKLRQIYLQISIVVGPLASLCPLSILHLSITSILVSTRFRRGKPHSVLLGRPVNPKAIDQSCHEIWVKAMRSTIPFCADRAGAICPASPRQPR